MSRPTPDRGDPGVLAIRHAFGRFAQTAVNDSPSVVATATTYGPAAANYAVVVKLTRTLLILPIVLGLSALVARRTRRTAQRDAETPIAPPRTSARRRIVETGCLAPWFLIGFLLLAAINSLGLVPAPAHPVLGQAAIFLIAPPCPARSS